MSNTCARDIRISPFLTNGRYQPDGKNSVCQQYAHYDDVGNNNKKQPGHYTEYDINV